MKKVILYIRVSTDEQADKGFSQRFQEELLERYAAIQGHIVVAKYFEDHSAKTFQRPEFSKLLMQIRKNRSMSQLLLFTKWDRFSRNAADAYQMIGTLNRLGVEPQAVEQPLDLSVPENKMMLAFYLAAPEVENDRRAMNVLQGMRRAKKEGRHMGIAPFGYSNKISEGGRKYIEPNKDADHVRWIYKMVATGKFTAESVWKKALQRGVKFQKNAFWLLMRNPVYCGLIRVQAYKSEVEYFADGQHQEIITKDLFYSVQDVLDGNKKVQRTKITVDDRFPLRGFLICEKCGRLLTASSSKGRNRYYAYYHCTNTCGTRHKAETANIEFIYELNRWKPHPAIGQLYKLILKDVYEQQNVARSSGITKIKLQIIAATERQQKALNMLMDDHMAADDYRAIKQDCEKKIYRLQEELAMIDQIRDLEPLMKKALIVLENIGDLYTQSTTEKKREIIGSIFPDKLCFDGFYYRTTRVNEAVRVIYNISMAFSEIKMGQIRNISELSREVNKEVLFSNLFLHHIKLITALVA